MCRNIRTLFNFEPPATDEEVQAAALQFVRKLSGYNSPSQANAPGLRARGPRGHRELAPAGRRARHHRPAAQPRGGRGASARPGRRSDSARNAPAPRRRHGLEAKRDSLSRSAGGSGGCGAAPQAGNGLEAKRDSLPRSGGWGWGARRSAPQNESAARGGRPRRRSRRRRPRRPRRGRTRSASRGRADPRSSPAARVAWPFESRNERTSAEQ